MPTLNFVLEPEDHDVVKAARRKLESELSRDLTWPEFFVALSKEKLKA